MPISCNVKFLLVWSTCYGLDVAKGLAYDVSFYCNN